MSLQQGLNHKVQSLFCILGLDSVKKRLSALNELGEVNGRT